MHISFNEMLSNQVNIQVLLNAKQMHIFPGKKDSLTMLKFTTIGHTKKTIDAEKQ